MRRHLQEKCHLHHSCWGSMNNVMWHNIASFAVDEETVDLNKNNETIELLVPQQPVTPTYWLSSLNEINLKLILQYGYVGIQQFKGWLHETGTNSDRYQSENYLRCLHETGMKLKHCSCKYFSPHSEFLYLIDGWSGEISRFHEENFVPVRVRTGLNSFVSVQNSKWMRPVRT